MMSMRKLLLGTTALVGASVLGVATPDVARAAEVLPGGALDVTISGFARFLASGVTSTTSATTTPPAPASTSATTPRST